MRPHLTALAATTVITVQQRRVRALDDLEERVAGTLAHWGAGEGTFDTRIGRALEVMASETEAALAERIVTALAELAPKTKRVRHPEKLTRAVIRRWVDELEPAEYERLTGCNETALRSELYAMDREI